MYFTIPVEQIFIFVVLSRYPPFVIEILLDRPVQEVDLMIYLVETTQDLTRCC